MKSDKPRLTFMTSPFDIEELAVLFHRIKCFHPAPLYKIGTKKDYEGSKKLCLFKEKFPYIDDGELNVIFKFYSDILLNAFADYIKRGYIFSEAILESVLLESQKIMDTYINNYKNGKIENFDFDLDSLCIKRAKDLGYYKESKRLREKYKNYRINEIENKISNLGVRPLDIMLTGVTGAGKSTTINSLLEKNVAELGKGIDPQTMELDSYLLNKFLRFWDTPGLGDGVKQDKQNSEKLIDILHKTYSIDKCEYGFIDVVIVIVEGINRDMGMTYSLINEVLLPNFPAERLLVVINQCDVAMKGRHWNIDTNKPDEILKQFLENKVLSVERRIREDMQKNIVKPIYYSATCGYNITNLLDLIISNIPDEKRKV